MSKYNTLAELVAGELNEKSLSTRDVEIRARKAGFIIDQSYVSKIKNGYMGNVTVDKLEALSAGLGVPLQELFNVITGDVAEEKRITNQKFKLLADKYQSLDKAGKREMDLLLKMIDNELDKRASKFPRDGFAEEFEIEK